MTSSVCQRQLARTSYAGRNKRRAAPAAKAPFASAALQAGRKSGLNSTRARPCRWLFWVVTALLALAADPASSETIPNQLTHAEKLGGWQRLFDGKTPDGWRNYRKSGIHDGWQVRDGALMRVGKGAGDIVTDQRFEHFELSLEYRVAPDGNSGVMFHVAETAHQPWQTGPEVQIVGDKNPERQRAGWLYGLYQAAKPGWLSRFEDQVDYQGSDEVNGARPGDQWNHLYLRIAKSQCEVTVNGVHYFYFQIGSKDWNERVTKSKFAKYPNFGKTGKGHICLQDHGNEIAFRNIKIRKISAQGEAPDPVDDALPLKVVNAFPDLQWQGWDGADEQGRVRPLRPTELTHAGDGSNRLFVATQRGPIYVLPNKPDVKLATTFLDLTPKVHDWTKDNEEGLLGLAFHPAYKKNGTFFVYYSSAAEPRSSIISRFRVSQGNPNVADPDSEEVVLKIQQPFSNHNGGSIEFGPDGFLYIGLGDGGNRNDPLGNGQNLQTLLGSILRIDVDRRDGDKAYGIPADNPFVDRADARPEIYAYGLRNVWRLAFDRQTGDLWAADVGQDLWEEINRIRSGGNYGWSLREGLHAFGNAESQLSNPPIEPVWEYDHRAGKSITGGRVYRGSTVPEIDGRYVYADYVTGKLWALQLDDQHHTVAKNSRIPSGHLSVIAFGEDEDGELYILAQSGSGKSILRLARDE